MNRMIRKGWVAAAGCALALTAAACGGGSASPGTRASGNPSTSSHGSLQNVTIGLTSFNSLHIEFMSAVEEGLMKPFGVNVKLPTVQSVALGVPGLVSGSLQFAPGTSVETVEAHQKSPEIVAVAAEDSGLPYQLIGGKNITSLSQLKGKTIGVDAVGSSLDYLAIVSMIHKQDPSLLSQVHFINGGDPAERVAALSSGKIAALGEFPPQTLELEAKGFHSIATSQTSNTQMTFILASKNWLNSHHALAVKFMEGYIASLNWLNNPGNKATAVSVIAKEMKVSEADATSTYNTMISKLHQFPTGQNAALNPTAIENGLNDFRAAGVKVPSNVNISGIYTNSLVNDALKADPSLKTGS